MTDEPIHSYDNDPIFQAGVAGAFNSGLGAAAIIVLQYAEAMAGTGGAAVGEMPATFPASALSDLYTKIMSAQKPVPTVPDAAVSGSATQ